MPTRLLLSLLLTASFAHAGERAQPFVQEAATHFSSENGLPGTAVQAVCIDPQGNPVAATDSGVIRFDGTAWNSLEHPPFTVKWLATAAEGVFAADEHRIALYRNETWMLPPPLVEHTITTLCAHPQSLGLLLGTDAGLFALDGLGNFVPIPGPKGPIRAIAQDPDGEVALGTEEGLYARKPGDTDWAAIFPADQRYRWAPRTVTALAFDRQGRLCFGAQQGAGIREGETWRLFTGREGLPYNPFTAAVPGEDDTVWFATQRGVVRWSAGRFAYRFSRRWLIDDHVNAIAVQDDGTAWLATPAGITRIQRRAMTLDDKAAYFTQQTEARHNRDGFIADCALKERYNPDSWQPKISDNDGLYTANYGAAQAFRYAVTQEPEAKALAQRSFAACKWLVDVTGTGMPARVIIPSDWHEPVNEQYGDAYNRSKREGDPFWKLITPRFVATKDGKYLWKCDTSSDELAGHYFFYGIYYDLVANTEPEKEPVRQTVRAITDHLIDNGFLLRDHDGLPTRWGNFSPDFLNSVQGWDQRGLNSMMMLSFLKVAEHITGDPKYAAAAQTLHDEHQYHINAMHSKEYFPPENVVPWDNNLCLQSWYGLIQYETDPERMLMWRLSVQHAWQHISKQKNALWNVIYQASAQRFNALAAQNAFDNAFPDMGPLTQYQVKAFAQFDARREDTLETLRGIPLDLIGYHIDNRQRLDVLFDPTPGAQGHTVDRRGTYGWHYDTRALPIEERGHVRQDRDAFNLDASEDDGWAEHEGTLFLLPYWMAVYHGFID